jgi:hypothetical protein
MTGVETDDRCVRITRLQRPFQRAMIPGIICHGFAAIETG